MRRIDLTLIARETNWKDEFGVNQSDRERKDITGDEDDVTRAEFVAAGQTGNRADRTVRVSRLDYDGEPLAEIDGKLYDIYRTYGTGSDTVELHLEERVGHV